MRLGRVINQCLMVGAVVGLLMPAAACMVNPVSGKEQLSLLTQGREVAIGNRDYPYTTQMNNGLPPDDPALQEYVNRVGLSLARVSHRPKLPYKFNVVNSSDINAFALPGGKISITRGLINLIENEDELAAVLAHEVGHVAARHIVDKYTNQMVMSVVMTGVGLAMSYSPNAKTGMEAAGAAGRMILLTFTRDQERQADSLGQQYMIRAGYNPRAMVEMFRKYKAEDKSDPSRVEGLFRAHPMTGERIQNAETRVITAPRGATERHYRVASFRRALAVQAARRPAYQAMDRGDEHLGKQRFSPARYEYQRAIRLFPNEGLFHSRLGLALMNLKQINLSRKAADRGAELSPGVFFCRFVQGLCAFKAGDWEAAKRGHSAADKLLPMHPMNKLFLAVSYERLGDKKTAEAVYREVIKLDPTGESGHTARQRLKDMGAAVK